MTRLLGSIKLFAVKLFISLHTALLEEQAELSHPSVVGFEDAAVRSCDIAPSSEGDHCVYGLACIPAHRVG